MLLVVDDDRRSPSLVAAGIVCDLNCGNQRRADHGHRERQGRAVAVQVASTAPEGGLPVIAGGAEVNDTRRQGRRPEIKSGEGFDYTEAIQGLNRQNKNLEAPSRTVGVVEKSFPEMKAVGDGHGPRPAGGSRGVPQAPASTGARRVGLNGMLRTGAQGRRCRTAILLTARPPAVSAKARGGRQGEAIEGAGPGLGGAGVEQAGRRLRRGPRQSCEIKKGDRKPTRGKGN